MCDLDVKWFSALDLYDYVIRFECLMESESFMEIWGPICGHEMLSWCYWILLLLDLPLPSDLLDLAYTWISFYMKIYGLVSLEELWYART